MGKLYKVLKIDQLSRMSDVGGVEKFYRHQVKTQGGIILTVDIAETDFTAEKVAPIIEKKATEADKVLAL